jgi:RHS repeat-associated protein
LFTGKEHDSETGFDYFGARYYSSPAGRFATVDPRLSTETAVFDPQRWNRYSYVGNRPTRVVDPDGRGWVSVAFKVGKAVVKGGNFALEFAGIVDDIHTVLDGEASTGARVWSAFSLATEVYSPVSVGDAKGIGSFAVRHSDTAAEAVQWTRRKFRRNLIKLDGAAEAGAHAHHMFPLKFKREFDEVFKTAGTSINDPRFGAWWEAQDHLQNVKGYNERWAAFWIKNPEASLDQVLAFGRDLAALYGLKIKF